MKEKLKGSLVMKYISMNRPIVYRAISLLILFGIILTPFGNRIYNIVVLPLNRFNVAYLDSSQSDSLKVMLPIIGARALADAVEGSTVSVKIFGTGADVEIGDLVQPILDGLNIAWKGSLISFAYSSVSKYILLGSFDIARPFILICIFAWAIYLFINTKAPETPKVVFAIRKIRDFSLLISLTFLFIMPLSVYFSGKLSNITTKPLEATLFTTFDKVQQFTDMTAYKDMEDFSDKAEYLFKKSNDLIKWALWEAPKDVVSSSIEWFIIKFLNGIVFPLASLLFLVWMVRDILYPVLGLSDKGLARGDIEKMWAILNSNNRHKENI